MTMANEAEGEDERRKRSRATSDTLKLKLHFVIEAMHQSFVPECPSSSRTPFFSRRTQILSILTSIRPDIPSQHCSRACVCPAWKKEIINNYNNN